ncbi:alpha/beta fold hydrolase [Lysobacter korlensis]|uniref:Alpha/beta fold hydrolase n=1 Tax=Lysobacter korlensis TaxID=553636 RepID=A0ABV6RZ30_9GAMM
MANRRITMDENTTSEPSTRYLQRPDGRVAYSVVGSGPLIVTSPGMGDLRESFRALSPALAAAGFRVADADLRGHGDSDASFGSYGDVDTARDLIALVEELGGPAILIGNSMSAGAAVWAAAERPDLITGLVLVGPFVRNPPGNPFVAALFRVLMARPWARPVWRAYLPALYKGRRPADFEQYRASVSAAMKRPGKTAAFSRTTRTTHAPAEARIGEVRGPVLVVMGELDPDFPDPRAEADWIAGRLDATVVMVPEAGHYPQSQRPDLVVPAILDFARRVAADA